MNKVSLLLAGLSLAVATASAQKNTYNMVIQKSDGSRITVASADVESIVFEPVITGSRIVPGTDPQRVTVGNSTYTVGTMTYQVLPPMATPRAGHVLVPEGNDFVAAGGHTEGGALTLSAERFAGDEWHSLAMHAPHDGGWTGVLDDGRVFVGGGFEEAGSVGYTKNTDIYDPATQTFQEGPRTVLSRVHAKSVMAGGLLYVSGNWNYDLPEGMYPPMDVYDGNTFDIAIEVERRSNPYLIITREGDIIEFANTDYLGRDLPTDKNGDYFGDYAAVAEQKMYIQPIKLFNTWRPLDLPADVRSSDYCDPVQNYYYFMTRDKSGNYGVVEFNNRSFDVYDKVPAVYPLTQQPITFRGGAFVNDVLRTANFVGCCNTDQGQQLFILTYDYNLWSHSFSVGTAGPFAEDLMSASWLMLPDGRLACCGGEKDGQVQASAYIFTPVGLSADDTAQPQADKARARVAPNAHGSSVKPAASWPIEPPYAKK